ncbi:MAG: hypothetical protein ACUVQ1_01525 [Candidatus Kapaibacteriales bacterium]
MEKESKSRYENVIRDTRKNIRYLIRASRKLTREEMLRVVRHFNYDPQNLKLKPNTTFAIETDI